MPSRKYTDDQLKASLASARNMRELLISLGLVPRGGNYETVWRRISKLDLDASHFHQFQRGKTLRSFSDEEIRDAVRSSRSLAQVLRRLRIRPGGTQGRLKIRIEELGIDTRHFVGAAWRRGSTTPVVPPSPLEVLLVAGAFRRTSHLKARLIQEGVKDARCETCHREDWNGKPIPLELDHINGRRDDNRLENLRLLCPNCHAQTATYRGRNIGNGFKVS